ncbi:winged helix DNA-binding protein [Terasakiella sp. A23]|uniref:winged helix DNA-binding protein n=1 Tax=Terasakiella sp. FCG-A23 TaxID=3080561 RepID=UPI00295333BE|nr:winged helix DNA-binding protein [Terasakiella sp. A23]MDV7339164.1 winged helix DNA-binding protein [Terasakiella sp. A23]
MDKSEDDYPYNRHIVSSEHLASEEGWQLSEFEYGLIISFNAFQRWMTRCMAAVGESDFSPLDVLVLHNVNHRAKDKRLVDICFVLNIEDQHTVNYSLKKLIKAGFVEGDKRGKERFYSTTEEGQRLCTEYRRIRERCLVSASKAFENGGLDLSDVATLLRGLSGLYDQASRTASAL